MPSTAGLARAAASGQIPPLKVGESAATAVPAPAPQLAAAAQEPAQAPSLIEAKLDNLHALLEQRIMQTGGAQMQQTPHPQTAPAAQTAAPAQSAAVQRPVPSPAAAAPAPPAAASAPAATPPPVAASPVPPAPAVRATAPADETTGVQEEALSFIKLLYNTLLENEVDERYANELTDEAGKISRPNMSLDYALANVYEKMVLKFGMPQTIPPIEDNAPRAEIFIGPTGVGKTTTIAKLASKLHLQEKKKVALLTIDTYRIAAAEQLRTYASIMETPFRVIYSVEEMKQAIDDFRDYDYLMVDTAGHSLHNEEQKENIAQFIRAIAEEMDCDNYLVLSATTKYRDLIEIADTYATMVDYRLIFTKMDETRAAGNLYNIRMHTGAPMSYITNGQDVPDDIEVFNAQKIVKGLLGGKVNHG
ncbi:MAG: AAA family ATPase [Lachnospiraceae bacterium]|nr:AAA family ATPase [Lachnospiraceae bacterium]